MMRAPPDIPSPVTTRFDTANRLFFRLYQCANLIHKNGTRAVEAHGATTQQWAVLGALARPAIHARGMSVKNLIGFLQVSRQNLTAVLDRLEARGWVERIKDEEDGRSRLVRLTREGDVVWANLRQPIEAFYDAALNHLSAVEQAQISDLLDRFKAGLEKA